MQLIPRYLVSNRTTIVANDAGFITEYRPVYNRHVKVYRGIDNDLEFRILNADQKPVDLTGKTIKFVAFADNNNLVIERDGTNNSLKGLATVKITDSDTLDLKDQFLSYNITIVEDATNDKTLTYSNSHFSQAGTIELSSLAFPGPKATNEISSFTQLEEDGPWFSNIITAEPGINGNNALHTIAVYTTAYTGTLKVLATLDNDVSDPSQINWDEIGTLNFDGTETTPTALNFYGVYNYLRFEASANPANTITKILLRN